MKKYILLIASLVIGFQSFAGGGWPQKKGHGYFKLSQWWVVADQHFTTTGEVDPNLTLGIFNTNIYAEFGVTNRFTGILNMPVFSRATINNQISGTTGDVLVEGDAINTLGDAQLGFKYGIITDKKYVLAGSVILGLPFGENAGGRDNNLQTGDGEFNQMIRMDLSTSGKLGKFNTFYTAYAGFNQRTNGFSDEFRYGFEAGLITENQKGIGIIRFDGIESLMNGDPTDSAGSGIFENNTEYLAFTLEGNYKITEKIGVSANVGGAFWAKLILARPSYSVGVFLQI